MDPRELKEALEAAVDWLVDYRSTIEDHPVLARVRPGDIASGLDERPPESGEPLTRALSDLDEVVLPGLTHWNHPGFMAYFPSSSGVPGIVGELLAAGLNQNAMLWRTSPAATEMEERVVDWIRQAVGLPGGFRGVIQDTASSGSFTSLLAAREALGLEVRRRGLAGRSDVPALTVHVSREAHSSLEKAAIAAGLGHEAVRKIPTDDAFRMRPDALRAALEEDRKAGRRPVMVCATVGTTSTASVDPVDAIADVCREADVWLHVDAAYAGPAAMVPEYRDRFAGWERADSVVLNPHKWLATPVDCSVLLFRDPEPFRSSLALTPEYLSSAESEATQLMDYGLPLGRRFRALKLWLLFRRHGVAGLRERLRDHVKWAGEFARRIREDPRFELAAPPSFSTVCFRSLPPSGSGADPERWNRRLLEALNQRGPVFLSHTELEGRFTLHLAVGGVETRRRHVVGVADLVAETWEELAPEAGA